MQYRDCQHSCSPLVDGNGCNDDLEEISYRINEGRLNVKECVKCSFWTNADGQVSGNENCPLVQDLGPEDLAEMTSDCPPYAKVACGSARSFHANYNGSEIESYSGFDDFRHCSPFDAFPEVRVIFWPKTINYLEIFVPIIVIGEELPLIQGLDYFSTAYTLEVSNFGQKTPYLKSIVPSRLLTR